MTAELSGQDFDINPQGPATRVLGSNLPAEWSWTVTPRSAGKKELRLQLAVLLDENHATPIAGETYTRIIEVRVHPLNTPLRLVKSTSSILGALGLTVAAVASAALRRWRRRRAADGNKSSGGAKTATATRRHDGDGKRRPPPKKKKRGGSR